MTQSLSVLYTEIRIHDGLYSLNDLHRAAGGEDKHRPTFFLRTDQTKALIEEIENCADMHSKAVATREGRSGGTYACKELVYAYAMWISAKFHLAVIRAFDALVSGGRPEPEPAPALAYASKEQREPLVKAIRRVVKMAERRGRKLGYDEAHAIVNLKLGVADVAHMTVEQVQRGVAIAGEMLEKVVLEGEYLHRDDPEPSADPDSERLTPKERERLLGAMRTALAGLEDGNGAMMALTNRIRVLCRVRNIDDLRRDDLAVVDAELARLREHDLPEYYKFRAEMREFLHREVIGAGTPWTPVVTRKWRARMKKTLPPRPDWLHMAVRELGMSCPLCGEAHGKP